LKKSGLTVSLKAKISLLLLPGEDPAESGAKCSNSLVTYFRYISFTARFAQDAKDAELEVFSFAVERTAKENQSSFILLQLYVFISNYYSRRDEFLIAFRAFIPLLLAGLSGKQ